ncbi:MAG: rod shape-determining protein [Bacillota bacterium]|nr:rod shape-determining protein [Bacillota bacterium]
MKFFTLSKDIGIDLGTSNTLLYMKGKGIILCEPSVIAVNTKSQKVLSVGLEAKNMIGRTSEDIAAVRPLKDGVIANFDLSLQMLKKFFEKATGRKSFKNSNIVVCHPSGITEVEERAINEAVVQGGARKVMLIEEPVAAALGAGLPVDEPTGSMIVDIGGGTTEVATISLGGIVTCKTLRFGGNELDDTIINYVKKEFNILIGEITAENTKIKLGSACAEENAEERNMLITGKDLVTGLPRSITVTERGIREALKEPIASIIEAIRATIEQTPPELSADIMDKGIVLSGGGALLRGLDKLIYNQIHIPVNIAENPLECAVLGAGKCLEIIDMVETD